MKIVLAAAAAACCVLASCASPQTSRPSIATDSIAAEQQRQSMYALEHRAADYRRVYGIAARLSRANADLCPNVRQTIGLRLENISDYPRNFHDAAQQLWHLSDMASVNWVESGSPAEAAGIHERDVLVAINGQAIRAGRNSSKDAFRLLRTASEHGSPSLTLQRGADQYTVIVAPQRDCGYPFLMVDDDAVNAAADGSVIMINRGALRFVQNDDELALVLGHELAHNAMGHIQAAQQNALMGAIGGAILDGLAAAGGVNTGGAFSRAGGDVGAGMFSREFEAEADYVGMYFMARAGYNLDGVEEFWRRMAAEHPASIRLAYTHPTSAERFLGLEAARAEIQDKVAQGMELRPNMRGAHAQAPTAPPTPVNASAPPSPPPTTPVVSVAPVTPNQPQPSAAHP